MFDRVTDLSQSLGGSGSVDDVDPGPLPDLLDEGEEAAALLANGGTIEYTVDGRSNTIETSGDSDAYVLVTDERILYVLGDQPDEAEIEITMTALTASHVRSGLLSSKLVVKTDDETVVFSPDEGDLEATEDYIDRIGDCWADTDTAFAKARAEMAGFEERCASGEEPREMALSARSHLSKARHAATREDDAPAEKIQSRVDEVEAELDRRRVSAWLDRVEVCVEDVTDAEADGDWDDDALDALVSAADAVDRAAEAIDSVATVPDEAEDRLAVFSDRVDDLAATFLADTEAEIAAARDAALESAAERWGTVADGYRAAVDAGWDGLDGVSREALEYQLAWVDAERLHALTARAEALEATGDDTDDGDEASEYLDEAETSLERALDIARSRSLNGAHAPDELEADLDRIEEKKLERSGWEFGNA